MEDLEGRLKKLIVSSLELQDVEPDQIDSDAPLFGAGLGLDSVEALELAIAVKKAHGVSLRADDEESRTALSSVKNLARYIVRQKTP